VTAVPATGGGKGPDPHGDGPSRDLPEMLRVEPIADGLALSGELTYVTADQLAQRLLPRITAAQPHILLDASDLTFCDSAGLSVLVRAYRQAHAHGGEVRLRGASRTLRRTLELTGLQALFGLPAARRDVGDGETA
jgi:anti-sigma B factor antagonist